MTQTIWILKRAVESATSHKLLLVVNWVLFPHSFCRDRDHHLKTFKSVVPASKLVDWLLLQVRSMLIKSLKLDTIKTKYLLASLSEFRICFSFYNSLPIQCQCSYSLKSNEQTKASRLLFLSCRHSVTIYITVEENFSLSTIRIFNNTCRPTDHHLRSNEHTDNLRPAVLQCALYEKV